MSYHLYNQNTDQQMFDNQIDHQEYSPWHKKEAEEQKQTKSTAHESPDLEMRDDFDMAFDNSDEYDSPKRSIPKRKNSE